MTKNAFTTIAAILLILYALTNFGASLGQFGKGKMVSGTADLASSMGNFAGDTQNAKQIKKEGIAAFPWDLGLLLKALERIVL